MYSGSLTLFPSQTVKALAPFIGCFRNHRLWARWLTFWALAMMFCQFARVTQMRNLFGWPNVKLECPYEREILCRTHAPA